MKNSYLLFAFMFFLVNLRAQEYTTPEKQQNVKDLGSVGYKGVVSTYNAAYEGIKGSPFIFEDWQDGAVLQNDSILYKGLSLKYDAYKDELLYLNTRNNTPMVMDKNDITSFTLAGSDISSSKVFVKIPYDGKKVFMQLIYEGKKIDFLKQYVKMLREADYQGAYNADRPYDEFVEGDSYFLRLKSGEMEKIKLNRNNIIKSFPDKQQELKSYAKKNDMKLNNEQDVIKLIKYYKTL